LSNESNKVVIYHANCTDGFTSAWLMKRFYSSIAEYVQGFYGKEPDNYKNKTIYLVDFSYPPEVIERLLNDGNRIVVIDHHITAEKNLRSFVAHDNFELYFDVSKSGAMLTYDWIEKQGFKIGETTKEFVEYVQDRDLWKFELQNSKEISEYIKCFDHKFDVWSDLAYYVVFDQEKCVSIGKALLQRMQRDVNTIIHSSLREVVIDSIEIPVANCPPNMASEAGAIMAVDHPFAATYYDALSGRCFSLRSAKNGMDVSKIAAKYGGGGHFHAAGFKVDRDHPLARF
jgi:uncharacterized protein